MNPVLVLVLKILGPSQETKYVEAPGPAPACLAVNAALSGRAEASPKGDHVSQMTVPH